MKTLKDVLEEVHQTTDFLDLEEITVNSKGLFNNSPLHVAVTWKDADAAEVLLKNGAEVNAVGEYGETPLHRAVENRDPRMVSLLLSRGADPRIKNQDGKDARALALEAGIPFPG